MNTYVKLIVVAAVLVVAVAGCQPLSGGGGEPTIAQSPSPTLLARGTFKAKGEPVELDATGNGDSITGTMTVGDTDDPLFARATAGMKPLEGTVELPP
jgi:hypothetical protein